MTRPLILGPQTLKQLIQYSMNIALVQSWCMRIKLSLYPENWKVFVKTKFEMAL